jgi:hypothetical protein
VATKENVMPKTIKLRQYLEAEKANQRYLREDRINSISKKNIVTTFLSALLIMGIIAITVLAYFSEAIYFRNIILGLFIVGLVIFIKAVGDQQTSIKRIKKN